MLSVPIEQRNTNSTPLRYYLTSIKTGNVTEEENYKYWKKCGKIGTLMHCWWNCELI